MKKFLKILANHSILIVLSIMIFGALLIFERFDFNDFVYFFLSVVLYLFSPVLTIISIAYAILFFRKENFLTFLPPLFLIYFSAVSNDINMRIYAGFFLGTYFGLILFLICLIIRLVAIVLIRKYKEKLKEWTGEEKVTSDAVFWARVLFKKLMKSIDPSCKF